MPETLSRLDLHCHSSASDGAASPSELARLVREAGLAGFALTDHDTASGVPEARRAAELCHVAFIPGVELTGYHGNREWHVQALFIEAAHDDIAAALRPFVRKRRERMLEMLSGLRSAGINLSLGEVEAEAAGGVLGRMHLASLLAKKGLVCAPADAFRRYIGDHAPFYAPKLACSVAQAIELAVRFGGVPVLAHPGIPGLDDCIPEFVRLGLVGIEAYTPKHTPAQERRYTAIGTELGLIVTAGSDFHGRPHDAPIGARTCAPAVLEMLLERRQQMHRAGKGN